MGPAARTDARHKISLSAVIQMPWGIYASPVFRYRSALPLHIWYGYDANLDGVSNDLYPTAFEFTGVDDAGVPSYKEMGACETVNCGRGAALSTFSLRVSKVFRLPHGMNIEAIAEGFNLFNAINPNFGIGAAAPSAFYHGHGGQSRAEHRVHEADCVFRRRRSTRAARRADWVQVYFLGARSS